MLRFGASWGKTYGVYFGKFFFTLKRGTNQIIYIILASIDVWQSCFAHSGCQIHFTLFCAKLTFVQIHALFRVK